MMWIESHQSLGRHYKTKRLARLLGVSCAAAVGHLHFLWWWCLDYAQDGCLGRCTREDIADAAELECEANTGVQALIDAGFLDDIDGVLHVHDWYEYAGKLIEKRENNAERMRKARAANVQRTCSVGAGLPNLTEPNHTEQNRTEETACVHANGATPESPPPPAPVVLHDVDTIEADRRLRLEAKGATAEEIAWALQTLKDRKAGWKDANYLWGMITNRRQEHAVAAAPPRLSVNERALQTIRAGKAATP